MKTDAELKSILADLNAPRLEAYRSLIKVASILARGDGLMSPAYEDHKWYSTTPMAERRRIIREAEKVDSLCKDLAMRIKDAADALYRTTSKPGVSE